MNREEILEEISELKERLNNLEKQYDSITLPNKRWSAEIGCSYYYITARGLVEAKTEAGLDLDNSRYEFGNYFRTREQAEFEAERLKVITELREWATPANEFDWDNSEERKYTILLESNEVRVDFFSMYQSSDLYFKTKEQAEEAIRAVGKDRITKYYFRR